MDERGNYHFRINKPLVHDFVLSSRCKMDRCVQLIVSNLINNYIFLCFIKYVFQLQLARSRIPFCKVDNEGRN